MSTINNDIPYVPENTIDPAAGLNLSLKTVDALLQSAVLGFEDSPPVSPAEGDRHVVGTGTGVWAGKDDLIAQYLDGAWSFYAARYAVNLDDGLLYFRAASGWSAADTGGTAFADITGSPDDSTALAAALDAKEDAVQDNLSASVPPTVDNDETEGYAPRSRWFDIVARESYLCLSADDGAAVWVQTSLTLDELGSAALADVGTAPSEIPTNAQVVMKWDSLLSPAISSGALTLDITNPAGFSVNLNANVTDLTFANAPVGKFVVFAVAFLQDGTGGRTITWPAAVQGSPVQPSPSAGALTIMSFATLDGGATIWQAV